MTIREMLYCEMDVDVCDDVYDELFHAYCGPYVLTDFGLEQFSDILDLTLTMVGARMVIVHIDSLPDYAIKHKRLRTFFKILAGYCPDDIFTQIVDENATYMKWKE